MSASEPGAYDAASRTVTWTFLNQAPGTEGKVTLKVKVNDKAKVEHRVDNQAGVQVGNEPEVKTEIPWNPVPDPHKTELTPGNGLPVKIGDTITYEISWENYENEAATITITDELDPGVTFQSASDGGQDVNGVVTWVLPNQAAGASGKVTLTVVVNENSLTAGHVGNQAEVQVGNHPKVKTEIVDNPVDNPTDGSLQVTKMLTYNGGALNAIDQTFYVALYYDEACTQRATDVKALRFVNGASASVTFDGLDVGRTYYVGETDASGQVITAGAVEDGTVFAVNFNEGQSAVVTESDDGTTTVEFENVFMQIPEQGFYKEGTLNITKKVLGANGAPVASDETFYAGIFSDPGYKKLSEDVSQNIVPLHMNGSSEASASVQVVYTTDNLTLYVTEVDANGVPVGEGFGYKMTVSNGTVIFSEPQQEETVTITNQKPNSPSSTTPETPGGNGSSTGSGTVPAGSTAVKTGDSTPIMTYVLMLAAALCVLTGAGFMKRRANKK